MSRNPYAHPIEEPELQLPQRVSGLAVTSLVFGILCCIPGVGLLGTIFGAAALIRISGSAGRLTGRALAFIGLILGLLGSMLWIGMALGVMYFASSMHVYGDAIAGMTTGNLAQTRAMIEPVTSSKLTDEQLKAYGAEITADLGNYRGLPQGMLGWLKAYGALQRDVDKAISQSGTPNRVLPIPLRFDKGLALGVFEIDSRSPGTSGAAQVTEIGIVLKDGRVLWLVGPPPRSGPQNPSPAPAAPAPGSGAPAGTGPP